MRFIWNSKLAIGNFAALVLIKSILLPSSYQFALLLQEAPPLFKEGVIANTNALRTSLNLAPLKESTVLNIAAAQKLQDMIQHQYFAHFSPEGVSPWHWFQVNKYSYTHAGENLAIGFIDPKSTVDAWANSASHRRNMVSPYYKEIGVAAAEGKIKDMEGIIVVQFFGTPTQQVAAASKSGFSIGLSQSGASQATPAPTPVKTPSPSPTPAVIRTSQPSIAINDTSALPGSGITTDDIFTRVDTADPSPTLRSVGKALNNTFVLYTFIIALTAIVALMFSELRRELLLKVVVHMVLFSLAALVPLLNLSRIALIL
jgi:uncharacterized protein YkwD